MAVWGTAVPELRFAAEIDAWGKVGAIIVPNGFHRLDAQLFADRYPDAHVLCPSGAKAKVEQVVNVTGSYEDLPADGVLELQLLDGTKQREGVMIVRSGGHAEERRRRAMTPAACAGRGETRSAFPCRRYRTAARS